MSERNTTEELAAGHQMTWQASTRATDLKIMGSANLATGILTFKGSSGEMLPAAELVPEYQSVLDGFREKDPAYARLQMLREKLKHNAECRAELQPRLEQLASDVEAETDLTRMTAIDEELDWAKRDERRLVQQQERLERGMAEAYQDARRVLEERLRQASAKIIADAREGRERALDALGPRAAKLLTQLVIANVRQAAASQAPDPSIALGDDPRSRVLAVDDSPAYDGQRAGVFMPLNVG